MEGAESWTPALLEIKVSGSADRAAQFPVAAGTIMLGGCSHGHCSPPATVFSGAMGSGAPAGGPGLQAPPPLFGWCAPSLCFSPPIFTYIDVWNSLASWCVGQRKLC